MFEVAWCVMLYSTVLLIEFSPVVFEKIGWHKPVRWIKGISIPLVIAGVLLSTLHQSSLGTLFLIMPGKLYELWYSSLLPVMFFLSAVSVGFAMVIFESSVSSYVYKKSLETDVLIDLGRFMLFSLLLYLAVKFQDLFIRKVVHALFIPRIETLFFWLEILLLLIPMVLLMFLEVRVSKKGLFICSCMVISGVILNRLNVSIVGLYNYTGIRYLPSLIEVLITLFIITIGIVVFNLAVKYLNIFEPIEQLKRRK
jgi:Ni/Fe-hydrogenase subunit HybB-like protein